MTITELTNDAKRREFIEGYKSWELWLEDEFTETSFYIYDDMDLDRVLCVEERKVTRTDWSAGYRGGKQPYPTYEGVDLRYAMLRKGKHYHDCRCSITEMLRYLKKKARELREEAVEG